MPETKPVEHADVSYEHTDAKLAPIAAIGIGIVVLGLFTQLLCWWIFDLFKVQMAFRGPALSPLAARERPQLPKNIDKIPAPRLQVDEHLSLEEFQQIEEKRLNGYGWADANSGKVHIPITEAMRLMANPEFAKDHGIRVEQTKPKGEAK
jgi:hypothetical protein